MGLRISIFKPPHGDCSNDGLSSRVAEITVVNIDAPFEPSDDAPPVLLERGNLPGTVKLVPAKQVGSTYVADHPSDQVGPMFGGCYGGTSDSRLGEAISRITGSSYADGIVALHDRFESAELARAMSL
jgi:hypothetical protein